MSNSRLASSPTTKKKKLIRPPFSQCLRSCEIPWLPTRIESRVVQRCSYETSWTLTQTSAASVAASRTTALPVSVRRKLRSGVSTLRAHAVRSPSGAACASATEGFWLFPRFPPRLRPPRAGPGSAAQAGAPPR